MTRFLRRFFQLLMVVCFVAAVFDFSWTVVAGLFAASFIGFVTVGMIEGSTGNRDYEAAVLEHHAGGESASRLSLFRPVWSLVFLVGFAALAGTAIGYDNPWIVMIPFGLLMILGIGLKFRERNGRAGVWQQFAQDNSLKFHHGSLWNPRDTPYVADLQSEYQLKLGTAWQRTSHSRSSSEVLIGTVKTIQTDDHFCVDDQAFDQSRSDIVAQLMERQDLARRLRAVQPGRLSLFEGTISLHAPRVPRTAVELRFYVRLLTDMSDEIERIAGQHS